MAKKIVRWSKERRAKFMATMKAKRWNVPDTQERVLVSMVGSGGGVSVPPTPSAYECIASADGMFVFVVGNKAPETVAKKLIALALEQLS